MGDCRYCGEAAGWFRSQHPDCTPDLGERRARMIELISSLNGEPEDVARQVRKAAGEVIVAERFRKFVVQGFGGGVERVLEDGLVSEEEEIWLFGVLLALEFVPKEKLSLEAQNELNAEGAYVRLVHAGVLRDLVEGKTPNRIELDSSLPFNLQKSEKLLWVFTNVLYRYQTKRREFVGGSQGMSVRVARGMYFRLGGFRGRSEEYIDDELDVGVMGVTNKHIYFAGDEKIFRIRHDKIVAVRAYENAVTVQRDSARARPETFDTGDGWFTHNLLMNATNV